MDKKYNKALYAVLHKTKEDILKWERIRLAQNKNRFLSFYIKKNNLNDNDCKLFGSYYKGGYIFIEVNKDKNKINILVQPNILTNLTLIKTKDEDVKKNILKEIYNQERNRELKESKELDDFLEELIDD